MSFFPKLKATDGIMALLIQFIKFGAVGLSNTAIFLGIYYLFIFVDRDLYMAGNMAGFCVSVLNAYFWNSKFVFKGKKEDRAKQLVKTFIVYGATFLVSTALLFVMVQLLKMNEIVAPLVNLVITVPLNFILNKLLVYKNPKLNNSCDNGGRPQ